MAALQTTAAEKHIFDQGIEATFLGESSTGSKLYTGDLKASFCIGSVPNGGYVATVMLRAVMQHYSKRVQTDPVAMNCFFTTKTTPGPCVVEIDDIKLSSRGYCVSRAQFKQPKDISAGPLKSIDDYSADAFTLCMTGIFTFGNFANEEGVNHIYKPSSPPSRETLESTEYRFMNDLVNVSADRSAFSTDEKVIGRPELHHVIGFKDERPIDLVSIPFWCDMIIPPAMMLGPAALGGPVWVPTMQMEVLFKAIPKGKEVFCKFISRYIINGREEMDGELFDEDGTLIALTRHQCLVVPWSRNTKL